MALKKTQPEKMDQMKFQRQVIRDEYLEDRVSERQPVFHHRGLRYIYLNQNLRDARENRTYTE